MVKVVRSLCAAGERLVGRVFRPGTVELHMTEKRIVVAHSPDSDDAFMFYGLASNNVDTGGIVVDQVLSDIETLNRAAFDGKYEVTAVSFHAFAHLVRQVRAPAARRQHG